MGKEQLGVFRLKKIWTNSSFRIGCFKAFNSYRKQALWYKRHIPIIHELAEETTEEKKLMKKNIPKPPLIARIHIRTHGVIAMVADYMAIPRGRCLLLANTSTQSLFF